MTRKPIFELKNLRVSARDGNGDEIEIIKGVSFHVRPGEVVALIGESGSGKTTLGLSALGYHKPGLRFSGGEARLIGRDLLKLDRRELLQLRGDEVAYVAQSAAAAFNPSMRINRQVIETAISHGKQTRGAALETAQRLYRVLDLPNPQHIGELYPHQVSGGQLQRLMVAMALINQPQLLVLDEPTTALDVTTQEEVLRSLKRVIKDQETAVIYVTHDLAVVSQIADRIIVLHNGSVVEEGTMQQVLEQPRHPYTKRLIAAHRADLSAKDGSKDRQAAEPALETVGVSAGYGAKIDGQPQVSVLDEISLTVVPGQVLAIIGESGCGKSTFARVLSGELSPAKGSVLLRGVPLRGSFRNRSRDELRRIQVAYQMADTALNPHQKIGDIIARPLRFYFGVRGPQLRKRVAEILNVLHLPESIADRYPGELSGGQKQRVNLARALAAQPEVIICDEVTSALDTIVAKGVIELLREIKSKTNIAIIFISHDIPLVSSFADNVAVFYAGRVVEYGPAASVLGSPQHPYTKLLVAAIPEMRVGWLAERKTSLNNPDRINAVTGTQVTGCVFLARCPHADSDLCGSNPPPMRTESDNPQHTYACHFSADSLDVTREERTAAYAKA
jgi:peptide/nickel transport system ATP-binding protein